MSSKFALNLTTPDGTYEIPFEVLDQWQFRNCQGSIIMGVRIGGCIMTMITLFLVIKVKRPVFYANLVTLFFVLLKSLLYVYYYLGPSVSFKVSVFEIQQLGAHERNVTVATNVCQIFIILSLEVNMLIQVWAMLSFGNKWIRNATMLVCTALALATVAMYVNSVIYASLNANVTNHSWQINVPWILFLCSVWINSGLLVWKLLFAISRRRRLGLQQFNAYHVLCIMALQTMVIPSAINLVQYLDPNWRANGLPEVSIFLTAVFMPLSSMWASSATNNDKPYSSEGVKFSSQASYSDDNSMDRPMTDVVSTNFKV